MDMLSDTEVHELRFAKELINPINPLGDKIFFFDGLGD
jgi:hypothetical protein